MQKTHFKGCLSEAMEIAVGITQGSILGPLLLLVFINYLPGVIENATTNLYADDTSVIASGMDVH